MVGAGVIAGVVLIWLASRRVEFAWRALWLLIIVVAVAAGSGSMASSARVMGFAGGGLWEFAHGIGRVIGLL